MLLCVNMWSTIALLPLLCFTSAQLYNVSDFGAAQVVQDPFPYDFPDIDAAPAALFPMPDCHGITLEEATVDQLQAAMSAGSLSSLEILNCYLDRITQTNSYVKYAWRPPLTDQAYIWHLVPYYN